MSNSHDVSRRDFLKAGVAAGAVAGVGLGGFYFGYNKAIGSPVRVGVIGTGDEGSVLIGALNPDSSRSRPSPTSAPSTSSAPSTATGACRSGRA